MVSIDGVTRDGRDVRRDRRSPDRALAQALLVEAADGIGQAGDLVADDEAAEMLRTVADELASLAKRLPA